jgi:phage gp36-like protein
MDYEKKYKEALEWARKVMQGKIGFVLDEVLEKFPELKESEDERIRMSLIELFKDMEWDDSILHDYNMDKDKTIAWLEKQGESDETKAKMFIINKGYPIDTNGIFPTYEEMYNIIKEGLEKQGEKKIH